MSEYETTAWKDTKTVLVCLLKIAAWIIVFRIALILY